MLFYHVAGTDRVVVGDLVYCKGNETEKVTGIVSSECVDENVNDENCDDSFDPSHLDDISQTNVPEARVNLVKVSFFLPLILIVLSLGDGLMGPFGALYVSRLLQVFFPCCPK